MPIVAGAPVRREKIGAFIASLGELCGLLLLLVPAAGNPASAEERQEPEPAYFRLLVATCYTCHSAENKDEGAIPGLHGLSETDINELLKAYKSDRERGTIMNHVSKALTDAEIDRLSTMLGRRER